MSQYVIVGAGPVGSATATLLAERGDKVRVVTRSGGGPEHPRIERVAADASDADQLSSLTEGAAALFNCASPLYHRWLTDWPPLASAILAAAERTRAPLVTSSNLYGYGPLADGVMTEATPLAATHPKLRIRADMWRDALAAHEAGRVRATEVRASDYIQANSIFTMVMGKPLLAGKRTFAPGALDVPHSWTSINDVAKTLVAVSGDDQAWGRPWHVPTNTPMTVREIATRFTELVGAPTPKLSELPYSVMRAVGVFSPTVRELRATRYQFVRPFVIDATVTAKTFGLQPEPMEDALRETARLLSA